MLESPAQMKISLAVRPVAGSKPIAPDGEQVLTPPATFWDTDTPGSPMPVRRCFDGVGNVSPLTLDSSLFTPAYTPEDTSADDKAAAAVAIGTCGDWDPWGMEDGCGGQELLQHISWEDEAPPCTTKDEADWGEMNGFTIFVGV